jgi:hypothetical protein
MLFVVVFEDNNHALFRLRTLTTSYGRAGLQSVASITKGLTQDEAISGLESSVVTHETSFKLQNVDVNMLRYRMFGVAVYIQMYSLSSHVL